MWSPSDADRGANSVVGIILLVAVAIVIAVTVITLSYSFVEDTGAPTADVSFRYEQTPAGLVMTPRAIGTDVIVKLNGKEVATFESESAGKSVLLPTAPGDTITVISKDGEQSVLVQRRIDERSEVGDLIAYYPFESGSGNTVVDESGNGNDGTAKGNYKRVSSCGPAMDFDGSSGAHINVGDLTLVGPDSIDEFTIAIAYQYDGTGTDIQNLIEYQSSSFAWYMETDGQHGSPHRMEYNIGYKTSPSNAIYEPGIPSGPTQVLIGTYDGNEMALYRNGNQVGTAPLNRDVELGEVILAADSDPYGVGQNLDGRLCEVRLYYTAFDGQDVQALNDAMG